MELNEYQKLTERTSTCDLSLINKLINFGLGISGEGGEVADEIKKVAFHGHELDKLKLALELGDALWYIAALCSTLNLTLEDVAKMNIEKLVKRYTKGFNAEDSINRKV